MAKDDYMDADGIVTEARGNGLFLVEVKEFNKTILCTLSGKIRKNTIRILEGDNVVVSVSVFDPDKGRIIFRKKS